MDPCIYSHTVSDGVLFNKNSSLVFIPCSFNPVLVFRHTALGIPAECCLAFSAFFPSVCCPSARDRGVAGEAYV